MSAPPMDGEAALAPSLDKPYSEADVRAILYQAQREENRREMAKEVKETRKKRPTNRRDSSGTDNGPRIIRGDRIAIRPVDWLWPGWLARGKLHVLAGPPGVGKSTVALTLAAAVSSKRLWPDDTQAPLGDVLIWSGEDDPNDTLLPRLIAAGADTRRIHILCQSGLDGFELAEVLNGMEPAPALLLVDPLVSAVAADSHKNAEVRKALGPLEETARARQTAILGITHFSKGTQGRDPTERVTGSLAFGAAPRVVIAAAKIPEHEGGGRIIVRSKSNIGPDDGGFRFDLEMHRLAEHHGIQASRVVWKGAVTGTARELLHQAETDMDGEERTERQDAETWLREILSDGPRPVSDIKTCGVDNGFSWRTLQRAGKQIGVHVKRSGFGQGATWECV